MKIYFYEIDQTSEVRDKILALRGTLTDDIGEANAIVYSTTFQSMILDLGIQNHINFFISIKDFLTKEDPFIKTRVDDQIKCLAEFSCEENLENVTSKIESCVEQVFDKDSFSDLNRYLKLISIELVQNALIFGRLNNLKAKIHYEIHCGAQNYAIKVTDSFGTLSQDKLLASVYRAYSEKSYEMKKSGAGLGLSMVLSASDELSLLRKEGEFTQIRSIINKYKRLKEYKSKKTSLLFMEE